MPCHCDHGVVVGGQYLIQGFVVVVGTEIVDVHRRDVPPINGRRDVVVRDVLELLCRWLYKRIDREIFVAKDVPGDVIVVRDY